MPTTSNKPPLWRFAAVAPLLASCVLLTGCPSASTPTKESGGAPAVPGGGAVSIPGAGSPAGGPAGMPGATPGASAGTGTMPGMPPDASAQTGSGGSSAGTPDGMPNGAQEGRAGGGSSDETIAGVAAGNDGSASAAEPGFEPTRQGEQSLPDLRDNPRRGQSGPAFPGATAQGPGAMPPVHSPPVGDGAQPGATAAGDPGAAPAGGVGQGPLTNAEQVAILDAELERSTGDFDALILEEQAQQRQRDREQVERAPAEEDDAQTSTFPGGTASAPRAAGYDGPVPGGSAGGGPPADPAKYPPPEDIPAGDDDDVVARQLREAAMREPDPAVRERLWDEYRKYKGITQ